MRARVAMRSSPATVAHYQGYVMDIAGRGSAVDPQYSEAAHEALLERAPDPIIIHGEGRLLYANPAAVRLVCVRDAAELIGSEVGKWIRLRETEAANEAVQDYMLPMRPTLVSEGRIIRPDGQALEVEMCQTPVMWHGTAATQIHLRGLAPARRAEWVMRRNESVLHSLHHITSVQKLGLTEKLRELLALGCQQFGLPVGILSHIEKDRYEIVEAVGAEQLRGRVLPLGDTYCSVTVGADEPASFEHAGNSEWKTHPCYEEFHLETYIGTRVLVNGALFGTLNFTGPEPRRLSFTPVDLEVLKLMAQWVGNEIARQRVETGLRESEHILRTTFAQAAVGLAHVAPDGRWLHVNERLCSIVGYPEDELLRLRFQDITHADDLKKELDLLHRVLAGEVSTYQLEKRYIRRDGSTVWTSVTAALAHGEFGAPDFLILVVEDITRRKETERELRRYRDHLEQLVEKRTNKLKALNEQLREEIAKRKQAEQELRDSEERFRRLSEAAWEGIAITCDGVILDANTAFATIFGYALSDVIGRDTADFLVPERRGSSSRRLPMQSGTDYELIGIRKDGSAFPVELHNEPAFYRGHNVMVKVIRDLTQRMFLEEQRRLHQAELARVARLSTMGEMASGLAHELNQPLAAILNYTHGSLRRMESAAWDSAAVRGAIEEVAAQAERAGEIIRRLRSFVRRRAPRQDRQDVNELVEEVVRFLVPETRRSQVKVVLDLAEPLRPVHVDSIEIEQVILNLVRNAIEAMECKTPGQRQLTIRTLQGERFVEVQVSDRGTGLPDAIRDRLFDPFFTTKPTGTGLGLPISQSIVESHGGRLWGENNPDGGATFHFTLRTNDTHGYKRRSAGKEVYDRRSGDHG